MFVFHHAPSHASTCGASSPYFPKPRTLTFHAGHCWFSESKVYRWLFVGTCASNKLARYFTRPQGLISTVLAVSTRLLRGDRSPRTTARSALQTATTLSRQTLQRLKYLEGTPQRVGPRESNDPLVPEAHAVEHVAKVVLKQMMAYGKMLRLLCIRFMYLQEYNVFRQNNARRLEGCWEETPSKKVDRTAMSIGKVQL